MMSTTRWIIVTGLLAASGCRHGGNGPSLTAEYFVQGTARHASVNYQTSGTTTKQILVSVPWSAAVSLYEGDRVFLSAQIDTPGDRGSISVTINKNGVVYQTGTATAYPNTATVSGAF